MDTKKRQIIAYARKTGGINKSNTLEGVAASLSVDRDGELVLPSAFENSIPKFLKDNPVLLWNHDPSQPIGKVTEMSVQDSEVPFKAEFADTAKAKEIRSLFKAGALNEVSVGFMPRAWSDDPADKMPHQSGGTITDIELYELSAVAIPSNRDALARIKSASLGILSDIKGYKWAEDLAEEKAEESPEANELLDSLTDDDVLLEATRRLDIILGDEIQDGVEKHLACLRLQLLPILGEPQNCNHNSGNNPNPFESIGLDEALTQVRNCS